MGRPRKSKGTARANILRVRLTEDERKDLDAAAESNGLETSSWARHELLILARKMKKQEQQK